MGLIAKRRSSNCNLIYGVSDQLMTGYAEKPLVGAGWFNSRLVYKRSQEEITKSKFLGADEILARDSPWPRDFSNSPPTSDQTFSLILMSCARRCLLSGRLPFRVICFFVLEVM